LVLATGEQLFCLTKQIGEDEDVLPLEQAEIV
jgi:hypothetical protein